MSNPETPKNDYSKTLNLPETTFSMKAGLAQKEPQLLEEWEKIGLFEKIKAASKGKKTFILHDGPPYANGNIHIGHALNKILKDFIVKYKTMAGFNSYYLPGWDCHGLPIEHQLLKELKLRKSDVESVDFRKKAHDYAMKYVGIQREQFKRLGVLGEWDKPYLTLDPEYEYWTLKSLSELQKKNYIYRGFKPVNWCFSCETALAEAEVEYENHTSPSVYVKFHVNNPEAIKGFATKKKVCLLVWTTTPWTLLANVAVAINPEYKYALVETKDEILIVESSLWIAKVKDIGQIKDEDYGIRDLVKGSDLINVVYTHPFGILKNCKVVPADYVSQEDGTGLVHTAPGHGQDDFQTGLKYKLDVLMPVDDRGLYTKDAGEFAGEHVFKANEKIIEKLKSEGTLFAEEKIQHSYPHCWRCKNPVISRATRQWFLNVEHNGLRAKLKDVIHKDVKWIPAGGEERILSMVTTRPDWCLSRQRFWGVPIPALKLKKSGEIKLYPQVIEHFAEIVKKEGTNAWFEKDIKQLIPAGFKCPETGETEFEKTFDILDVWFDSGVSHQAVVKAMMKQELPIAMYLEGSDQHRGWFQSSLIPAVAIEGKAPFQNVLTHGFVVDGQGRKMSKSLGNVISPLDIMKNSGADILRLWVASSSYNEDIRISKEILDRLVDAYRKIRNTFRYLLGNLNGFNPDQDSLPYNELLDLDKWALYKLSETIEGVGNDYDHYEFSKVFKAIYTFCNEDLSSFYLDILKDRLYTSATKSPERRSAQTVLYQILNHLLRVMAPMVSFTAEEIFQAMPKEKSMQNVPSVHLLPWLDIPKDWHNKAIGQQFELLVSFRAGVLKALEDKRKLGEIGSSLQAKVIVETASDRDWEYLNNFKNFLPEALIVSQAEVKKVAHVQSSLSEAFAKTNVIVQQADGEKCGRCWNYRVDVGQDTTHPTLCARCSTLVKETCNA